jgi:hypothetical protein
VTFLQDVFHPLVTPLTTYTYSVRDRGGDTASAADGDKLPPGGLMLRAGFPEWFEDIESTARETSNDDTTVPSGLPRTVQLLHYMRLILSTPEILDNVPLSMAANPGAWHAWRSYRSKALGVRARSPFTAPLGASETSDTASDGSQSSRSGSQQPGGARRPGEWNWTGVWEERVRKVVLASRADGALFNADRGGVVSLSCNVELVKSRVHIGADKAGQIEFAKLDDVALSSILQQVQEVGT